MNFLNNIRRKLNTLKSVSIRLNEYDRAFISHNLKKWKTNTNREHTSEILIELCSVASTIISFSYFSNLLAEKYKAKMTAYWFNNDIFSTKIKKRRFRKIFRSFGVSDFIYPRLSNIQKKEHKIKVKSILNKINTKQDVENLKIDGLWVGDLVYDSHLRDYNVPTIDIHSKQFLKTIRYAVSIFIFWREYFNTHDVKAIVTSHSVYIPSIIIRIASTKGIGSYQVNAARIYHLNNSKPRSNNEHFDYSDQFNKLPAEIQKKGLLEAKERINLRFSGKVGVDMFYSKKSAYSNKNVGRILSYNKKIKILIAAHCFFDAPHPYGVNLFPDFYEWLSFLGDISEKTDYEWYIKTHPDYLPGNIPIIKSFLRKYRKFNFIPSQTSHLQLIDEGINFTLSVYGTIGFEYAAMGVPVIYASKCNPCVAYDFNIHPKSIEEYESILMDLPNVKIDIDTEKVYEFYFMRFIYNTQNWLYNDYAGLLKEIGGPRELVTSICYKKFFSEITEDKHQRIISGLKKFIESKEYYFQKKHMVN